MTAQLLEVDPVTAARRLPDAVITARSMVMFGPPGRISSYRSHGIHLGANISCQRAGGRQRAGTCARRAGSDVHESAAAHLTGLPVLVTEHGVDVDAGLRGDLIVDSLRIPAQAGASAVRLGSVARANGFDD